MISKPNLEQQPLLQLPKLKMWKLRNKNKKQVEVIKEEGAKEVEERKVEQ